MGSGGGPGGIVVVVGECVNQNKRCDNKQNELCFE